VLRLLAGYALQPNQPDHIPLGAGLVGQCAVEKKQILLHDVPAEYMRVESSLGESRPANILVLPVLFEGETKAVIELAALHKFTDINLTFLEQLTQSIGVVLNTIEATMRTEGLLVQSQRLTTELQARQSELQQTSWPNRTSRSSARTPRSNRRGAHSKRRRPSSRSPRNTSRSSWPI
jgi:GAF domain-containing protein